MGFLPINRREMQRLGWEQPDFVYVTGDAYVDHPSFGHAIISRILESHGYEDGATGSPKIILKTAYKAGMIKDEELWLRALQERNNVAHSYNERIALGIVMQAKESFYDMFCQLKNEIDKNWL